MLQPYHENPQDKHKDEIMGVRAPWTVPKEETHLYSYK